MAKWYYLVGGQETGPVESAILKRVADSGLLQPHDKVRRDGMSEWHPAEQVKGLFQATKSQSRPLVTAPMEAKTVRGDDSSMARKGPIATPMPEDEAARMGANHAIASPQRDWDPSSAESEAERNDGIAAAVLGLVDEEDAKLRTKEEARVTDEQRQRIFRARKKRDCPYCGEEILAVAKKCKYCGEYLNDDLRRKMSVANSPRWNPGVAAALSVLLPGLGQIYERKVFNGLLWMGAVLLAYFVGRRIGEFVVAGIASAHEFLGSAATAFLALVLSLVWFLLGAILHVFSVLNALRRDPTEEEQP